MLTSLSINIWSANVHALFFPLVLCSQQKQAASLTVSCYSSLLITLHILSCNVTHYVQRFVSLYFISNTFMDSGMIKPSIDLHRR